MNKDTTKNIISFGFWKSENEPNLPTPYITKNKYIDGFEDKCKQWILHKKILNNIESRDGMVTDDRWIQYMGYSNCRICNKNNGDSTYTIGGWKFPDGIFHYVVDHHIEIPIKFQEMIINEPLLNPDTLKIRTIFENIQLITSGMADLRYSM